MDRDVHVRRTSLTLAIASLAGVASIPALAKTPSRRVNVPSIAIDGWLVDASIALKWFLPLDREPDGDLARMAIGSLAMRTTSLAFYEVGNILTRHSSRRD